MSIKDEILKIIQKLNENINLIKNEETTKQVIIQPLLSILGYDFSNPSEIQSEFCINTVGRKDKIDYVILNNNNIPIAYIECKNISEKLEKHISQVIRYYSVGLVIVITNGIDWWFFSDTIESGICDNTPFFTFNINDFTTEDYTIFKNFKYNIENKKVLYQDCIALLNEKVKAKYDKITSECNLEFVRLFGLKELDQKRLKNIIKELNYGSK